MTLTDTWRDSRRQTTRIAPNTIYLHPEQPWPEGDMMGRAVTRGPKWRIGNRRGVWAICVDEVLPIADLVRVQWDRNAEIVSEYRISSKLHAAIYHRPKTEQEESLTRAVAAAQEFDALALDLWKRRDRR